MSSASSVRTNPISGCRGWNIVGLAMPEAARDKLGPLGMGRPDCRGMAQADREVVPERTQKPHRNPSPPRK